MIFKDSLAVLTHLLNHGTHYLLAAKSTTIESVLSLLTEPSICDQWLNKVTQFKLLQLAVQFLARFCRLAPGYVCMLVPRLVETIGEAKKNFSLSKNERLLFSSLKSLTSVLLIPGLPAVHVVVLPRTVRVASSYAGKCNWETFAAVVSFLLAYASHPSAVPGLAWGVVEVLADRRWEDGKRRRNDSEKDVAKCVAKWVGIYEAEKGRKEVRLKRTRWGYTDSTHS